MSLHKVVDELAEISDSEDAFVELKELNERLDGEIPKSLLFHSDPSSRDLMGVFIRLVATDDAVDLQHEAEVDDVERV